MCWTQQSCCFSFYSHKQASTSEIYYYYYHHRRDEYRAVPNPERNVVVIFGILQRKSGHSQRTEALHQYTNIARSPLAVRIRVGADCGESVAIERKEFYMWSVVFFFQNGVLLTTHPSSSSYGYAIHTGNLCVMRRDPKHKRRRLLKCPEDIWATHEIPTISNSCGQVLNSAFASVCAKCSALVCCGLYAAAHQSSRHEP